MTDVKREHREAAVFAMDGVAAAIAEAEQRGAERERAKNYATERQARQELWSFIRLHAGMYELQAASVEWLDAWAPELISGRYADIGSGKHLKGEE